MTFTWMAFTTITAGITTLVIAACYQAKAMEVARVTRHVRTRVDLPPWLEEQFTRADFTAWELELRSEERQQ